MGYDVEAILGALGGERRAQSAEREAGSGKEEGLRA
ncbi:MAG: hypothetical protein RI897_3491 [Verrucomicrobiota bacterium]